MTITVSGMSVLPDLIVVGSMVTDAYDPVGQFIVDGYLVPARALENGSA